MGFRGGFQGWVSGVGFRCQWVKLKKFRNVEGGGGGASGTKFSWHNFTEQTIQPKIACGKL